MSAELTRIVKQYRDEIRSLLSSNRTAVEKAVALRMFARKIASMHEDTMHYTNINEFIQDYERGRCPISRLEGEGQIVGDLFILKKCPMAPLFQDFKDNGSFPEYWTSLPGEFMSQMKNEAILHPLCIVHQSFRDELAKKIPKGSSFVHSIAVACRSGSNGAVVYNEFGMQFSSLSKEQVAEAINGMACAFYVQ